jgi:DNA polymerase IV
MARRYGRLGARLAVLARGEDDRTVEPDGRARSISAETTFARDEADGDKLAHMLRPLCETVAGRLKQSAIAAAGVTLKLKTADFRIRTRSRRLSEPTQLAEMLFNTARRLLAGEIDGVTRFRLIGVGADRLVPSAEADLPTLFDPVDGRPRRLEQALDHVRRQHGQAAVQRGLRGSRS